MTRVATIDMRRFMHLVVIAAMVIATLLAAMIPAVVLADNQGTVERTTGGSFSTDEDSSAPIINTIDLTDNVSGSASAMDPTVEYFIKVDVRDNMTLEHLKSLQVTIFYDSLGNDPAAPASVDNQTCAIITWTPTNTWTLTDMGAGSTWQITNGTTPVLSNNTGEFVFHFTPGKVATEDAGSADWDIYVKAIDNGDETGDLFLRDLAMNWYGEINTVSSTVAFGSVALGAEVRNTAPLHATYISNGNYSEQAKTDAAWNNSPYDVALEISGEPGDHEFTLWVNDESNSGRETQLTADYADIDDNETITTEDGDPNGSMYLWLKLGPSGIVSGTFTGDINFAINNR